MESNPDAPNTPVDIARIALQRLTALDAPPTPNEYVREYRRAAGLPIDEAAMSRLWASSPEVVEMVRAVVQVVTEVSAGFSIGMERFDSDSTRALANIDQIQDPHDLARLLQTVTGSALSLKHVIDTTRRELTETRERLLEVSNELNRSQALARTDPLTGFGNRRALSDLVAKEVARSRRTKAPFSLAVLDLDHFKNINDQHGHDAGDRALVHVARVAKASLRETDDVFRYGGEEFVVALVGANAEGARFVMDRMRGLVEGAPLVLENCSLILRFSAGVAELAPGENAESLLKRADLALYEAKSAGRNRVVVAAPPAAEPPMAKRA
jgi:diguanylate cyclase